MTASLHPPKCGIWNQTDGNLIFISISTWVTLGKLLNFSKPQYYLYLQK